MKIEMKIEGKIITIEGEFTIEVRDDLSVPAAVVAAIPAVPVTVPTAVVPVSVPVVPASVPVVAPAAPVPTAFDVPADPVPVPSRRRVYTADEIALYDRLSALRMEISNATNVPPYIIFHNKNLWEMVERMPKTLAEFKEISGVGTTKLDAYGEKFLAVIRGA